MIGPVEYVEITGEIPHQDDLERINCPIQGQSGHTMCGQCLNCGRPKFLVCSCHPSLDSLRKEILIKDLARQKKKVITWLKEVNEILSANFPGKDQCWYNSGPNDFWHNCHEKFYSPSESVNLYIEELENE